MARTVLRQFTGGVSDEIDAQNLRDDQGEEALDINLKGFALEPGEGLTDITDAGHYHYRGEWIRDSKAVSFEEAGIGVVTTYDDSRPRFEEIINDDENVSRNLGPSLPPGIAITGAVVSEGSRGLRPAEGTHLLKISGDKFGVTDTADPITDAPSLEEHKAAAATDLKDIYYYSGQPYWINKVSSTNWQVTTRQPDGSGGFTGNTVTSANLTHHSEGYLFKENYFICWDVDTIQTVALSSSSMSIGTFETLDSTEGGDAGSSFGFTAGATGESISSLDVCNGVVSFSQKIKTTNTTPENGLSSKYSGSDNERWILPIEKSAVLLLIRSEVVTSGSEATSTSLGLISNEGDDDCEVWINGVQNTVNWKIPRGGDKAYWHYGSNKPHTTRALDGSQGVPDENRWSGTYGYPHWPGRMGLKVAAYPVPANTWSMVKYDGADKPQIYLVPASSGTANQAAVNNIRITRSITQKKVASVTSGDNNIYNRYTSATRNSTWYFNITNTFTLSIPNIGQSMSWSGSPTVSGSSYYYWRTPNDTNYLESRDKKTFTYHTYTNFQPSGSSWAGGTSAGGRFASAFLGSTEPHDWMKIHSGFSKSVPGEKFVDRGMVKNKTSGTVSSYINRLCTFTPSGSLTQQAGFGFSKLWTQAVINGSERSITFPAASDKIFTVDDYIKISSFGGSTLRTLAWNSYSGTTQSTGAGPYFIAKITAIDNSAKKLTLEPYTAGGSMTMYNENCYPVISALEENGRPKGKTTDERVLLQPTRKVIQTDLFNHVLIGHHAKLPNGNSREQMIEVRPNSGVATTTSDHRHTVNWQQGGSSDSAESWTDKDIRAVTLNSGAPRFFYTMDEDDKRKKLFSQNGIEQDTAPSSRIVSKDAIYHLTSTLLTVVNDDKVNVYDPLYNIQYVHAKPEIATGLGITGKVQDAMHISNNYGLFVFIKVNIKWRLIRTSQIKSSEGVYSESSLMNYDFVKPLDYDGTKVWGIQGTTAGYNIHTAVPFFESDIANSWIYYASGDPVSASAWGQVTKSRQSKADTDGNMDRYLSVDWKYDSKKYDSN